jgi:hypothetical protein
MDCYDLKIESLMITYFQSLPDKAQRHYAAVEAAKLGHGGVSYSECDSFLGLKYFATH